MGNGGCPSHGWSILASAATNSQLAGVLAGFVFTGIVILFALKGNRYTQALGLFSAAVIVLAFDSYLFSVVTGMDKDPYCARVWSIGMAASGMLAVGAVGLICGICWLLAAHVDADASGDGPSINLGAIATVMTYGVAVAVALQLARTTSEYLVVASDRPETVVLWSTLLVPLVVFGTAVLLEARRRRRARLPATESAGTSARSGTTWVTRAIYGSLAYGVLTPVVAGVITSLPPHWWTDRSAALITATAVLNSVLPGALLVALLLAAPAVGAAGSVDHLPGPGSDDGEAADAGGADHAPPTISSSGPEASPAPSEPRPAE